MFSATMGICFLVLAAFSPRPSRATSDVPIPPFTPEESSFVLFAGAGFRLPIEEIAKLFESRTGLKVEASYAGSGCLIAQAELLGRGDVFIPGEESFMDQARGRGLVDQSTPLARIEPVVAVRKGNPLHIASLADLAQAGLRLGLGDPKSVAVGITAERWLADALPPDQVAAVKANVRTRALNVNELGSQLTLDALDAAIVWDATVPLFPELAALRLEGGAEHRAQITGAVLQFTRHPEEATQFMALLTSDEGRGIFLRFGYQPCVVASQNANVGHEAEPTTPASAR
ncbi:MAG: substrate-binding domain-containing protein [Candidatus Eisenbacteria bacterium]